MFKITFLPVQVFLVYLCEPLRTFNGLLRPSLPFTRARATIAPTLVPGGARAFSPYRRRRSRPPYAAHTRLSGRTGRRGPITLLVSSTSPYARTRKASLPRREPSTRPVEPSSPVRVYILFSLTN